MLTLDHFIESLMHEQDRLIDIEIIKVSNAHVLSMHESITTRNPKTKKRGKGKVHGETKKEGYSKPFDNYLVSKGGKGKTK
jgi:hypothetical protein